MPTVFSVPRHARRLLCALATVLAGGQAASVRAAEKPAGAAQWQEIVSTADPTAPLLERLRKVPAPGDFSPTGLVRADYLALIAGEIDFWKKQQNADGAIIDPYLKNEVQYSTPAFAHAAAGLVAWSAREDLVEPAAKALDWAVRRLADRKAASAHEDFYPPMIAHAMRLLKPHVPPARYEQWENDVRRFEPRRTYRKEPGSMNWNIVSASGEALFFKLGLRPDTDYPETSILAQGRHFTSPSGLYVEGPMAYDLFPRLFLCDLLASGYQGESRANLEEMMRRGAIASLFMQSPWGELPAGGRSAHHQWNEAQQCAVFEIYAARALREQDPWLAGVYKRAAHLALRSMQRWVRPSGELQIVKNWVDPEKTHAYEGYSTHSQYNLLPMSMLSLAAFYSGDTEAVKEAPAPADVGGYVFEVPELHKIFANAGGAYVEIDKNADPHYDATGLIRVHFPEISPQLGPSDSVLSAPAYRVPGGKRPPAATGVGVAWQDAEGSWHSLGELGHGLIQKTTLSKVSEEPGEVRFTVTYEGSFFGATAVVENYRITPARVEATATVTGYSGPLRYLWPVLADDGRTQSRIHVGGHTVSVAQDGKKNAQTFSAPAAKTITVGEDRFPNHNGWARLGVAEFAPGEPATLILAPLLPRDTRRTHRP